MITINMMYYKKISLNNNYILINFKEVIDFKHKSLLSKYSIYRGVKLT